MERFFSMISLLFGMLLDQLFVQVSCNPADALHWEAVCVFQPAKFYLLLWACAGNRVLDARTFLHASYG